MSTFPEIAVSIHLCSNSKGSPKQIYDILKKFQPVGPVVGNMPVGNMPGGNNVPLSVGSQGLKWDKAHCGQGVQF